MTNYLSFWWTLIASMITDKTAIAWLGWFPITVSLFIAMNLVREPWGNRLFLVASLLGPAWIILVTIPWIGGAFTQ